MKVTKCDRAGERGSIMVLFGVSVITMFLVAALAIDLGSAYVTTTSLSKAVDAAALAGARYTMMGEAAMQDVMYKVADANYGQGDKGGEYAPNYEITIWSPALDTTRVRVTGSTNAPAYFSRLFGNEEIPVAALAEATRYPLDMSLVLDLSYSLERNDAFDDMQVAARGFLAYFDDNVDRFGLVTYSTWGQERMTLQKNFRAPGQTIIDGLAAISDTNIGEGLRLAKGQLDAAFPRSEALKMVVLFTDGRPTAFADNFRMPDGSNPLWYDGVVASYISGSSYRGLFQSADGLKIDYFQSNGTPVLVANGSSASSPKPKNLPNGSTVNGVTIRAAGADKAEEWANTIRGAGYTIFTIALGNPTASDPGDTPDLEFLRRVANQDGIANANQPKGEMLFAPTPTELEATFAMLADRIITRLTR